MGSLTYNILKLIFICLLGSATACDDSLLDAISPSLFVQVASDPDGNVRPDTEDYDQVGTPNQLRPIVSRVELLAGSDDSNPYVVYASGKSEYTFSDALKTKAAVQGYVNLTETTREHPAKTITHVRVYCSAILVRLGVTDFAVSGVVGQNEFFGIATNDTTIDSSNFLAGDQFAYDRETKTIRFLDSEQDTADPFNDTPTSKVRASFTNDGSDSNGFYFLSKLENRFSFAADDAVVVEIDFGIDGAFAWQDTFSEEEIFNGRSLDIYNWVLFSPAITSRIEDL